MGNLKSFYTTEEMVSKLMRLPMEWEKILDKGLIARIYRGLQTLTSSKNQ
jgi:hypothetical protein